MSFSLMVRSFQLKSFQFSVWKFTAAPSLSVLNFRILKTDKLKTLNCFLFRLLLAAQFVDLVAGAQMLEGGERRFHDVKRVV